MDFTYLVVLIIAGFLITYMFGISYLKVLRGESSQNIKYFHVLLISLLFGGLADLLLYAMFKDIRDEDRIDSHKFIIFSTPINHSYISNSVVFRRILYRAIYYTIY